MYNITLIPSNVCSDKEKGISRNILGLFVNGFDYRSQMGRDYPKHEVLNIFRTKFQVLRTFLKHNEETTVYQR